MALFFPKRFPRLLSSRALISLVYFIYCWSMTHIYDLTMLQWTLHHHLSTTRFLASMTIAFCALSFLQLPLCRIMASGTAKNALICLLCIGLIANYLIFLPMPNHHPNLRIIGLIFSAISCACGNTFLIITLIKDHQKYHLYFIKSFAMCYGIARLANCYMMPYIEKLIQSGHWSILLVLAQSALLIILGMVILCMPHHTNKKCVDIRWHDIKNILFNPKNRIVLLFTFCLAFSFTMMQQHWLGQFLELGLTFSRDQAIAIDHHLLWGLALGCLLWGCLSRYEHQYRCMLTCASIIATIIASIVIFIPDFAIFSIHSLVFGLGACYSCSLIIYHLMFYYHDSTTFKIIALTAINACFFLAKTLNWLTTWIMDHRLNYLLSGHQISSYQGMFQHILIIVPFFLLLGTALSFLLTEKDDPEANFMHIHHWHQ